MGILGGEEAFFLEGAGGGLAVGTTGLAEEEVSGDGLGLARRGVGRADSR